MIEVADFAVNAEFATVQGEQLGPVMTMVAVAGSKFVPTMVRLNAWVAIGVADVVERLVMAGPLPTVSGKVPEVAVVAVFCTAIENAPLPSVAGPVTEVALFAVSAEFAMVQGVQLGPLMTIWAVAGSKPVPTMVMLKAWAAMGVEGVVLRLVSTGGVTADRGRVPEVALVAVFWTAMVNEPPPKFAGPVIEVADFAVRAELATVQGEQLGPLITMVAVAGSKPVPTIVRVNACPPIAVEGVVERLVKAGGVATVKANVAEVAPVAVFCTATVNDPPPNVAGPVIEVTDFAVRAELATVQGEQPGPLITMVAEAGSKFAPTMARLNACPPTAVAGVVERLVRVGSAATVSARVPEVGPDAPFWTATENDPELAKVAGPVREVAVLAVSAEFATVQGEQPGPVITRLAPAGSKFVPATVSANAWVATGVLGVVERLVIEGPLPTARASVPEIAVVAVFCTATIYTPLASVAGPATEVALFVVRELLATTQGAQLGPLITICAEAGSKLAPTMFSETDWPATGADGVVESEVSDGGISAAMDKTGDWTRRTREGNAPSHCIWKDPLEVSVVLNCRVKIPSPGAASPFRPSSCMTPSTATSAPVAVRRTRLMPPGSGVGSPAAVFNLQLTVNWVLILTLA